MNKYPSKKTKLRRLVTDMLSTLADISEELDRQDCKFDYLSDYGEEIAELVYQFRGLCYRRPYDKVRQHEKTEQ